MLKLSCSVEYKRSYSFQALSIRISACTGIVRSKIMRTIFECATNLHWVNNYARWMNCFSSSCSPNMIILWAAFGCNFITHTWLKNIGKIYFEKRMKCLFVGSVMYLCRGNSRKLHFFVALWPMIIYLIWIFRNWWHTRNFIRQLRTICNCLRMNQIIHIEIPPFYFSSTFFPIHFDSPSYLHASNDSSTHVLPKWQIQN